MISKETTADHSSSSLSVITLPEGDGGVPVSGIAEEFFALEVLPSHEPLPESGVEEHERVVSAANQETGQRREPHQELAPLHRDLDVGERVDRVVQFHGGQRDEGGERS